ncbi:MAG: alpha-L-fucosidase [Bacteroidota bacterium]
MKNILLLVILLFCFSCKERQAEEVAPPVTRVTYEPTWNSLRKHQTPQWLMDAKFGIYTHLSLKTIKNIPGNEEKMLHELIPEFKLQSFDAAAWAELFERSGARFAGPVAWHGSGFLHWDSELTDFNSVAMGPGIDIVGSLKEEITARGLKFITSYHTGYWYQAAVREDHPAYLDPKYEDLYGPVHDTTVKDAVLWKDHIEKQSKFSEYHMEALSAKMKEAITKYQPDISWVDVSFGGTVRGVNIETYKNGKLISEDENYMGGLREHYQRDYIAHLFNTAEASGKEVEFVYKERDVPPGVGMRNFENGLTDELEYDVWMTDIDICSPTSWFYKENLELKSADVLIDILADVVSKNGILLLNVPPKPDGSFADFIQKELYKVGDWLNVNGEAIYGTMPWVTFGEGPSVLKKTGHYSERYPNAIFNEKDIRFTQKDHNLYAICLGWPGKEIKIKSLGSRGKLFEGDIKAISLLGSDAALEYQQNPYDLTIQLPVEPPSTYAIVFKIERRE